MLGNKELEVVLGVKACCDVDGGGEGPCVGSDELWPSHHVKRGWEWVWV